MADNTSLPHVELRAAPPRVAPPTRQWTDPAAQLFTSQGLPHFAPDPYVVLGGPGTGKTSLLIDLACAHCSNADSAPDSVLLLTQSKRAAAAISEEIATRLAGTTNLVAQEPTVRTVHSYAYSLLSTLNLNRGALPPKMLTGAEKDVIYRELLETIAEDPDNPWPEWITPALTTAGFARELRDFLSRATERGVTSEQLRALGEQEHNDLWIAAADFAAEYEHIMLLRAAAAAASAAAVTPSLDAAETIAAVIEGFATQPEVLDAEHRRLQLVLVDDAHLLDPQMADLIEMVRPSCNMVVLAGDPDQNTFRFRGASSSYLRSILPDPHPQRIILRQSYRLPPDLLPVVTAAGERLTGSAAVRTALLPASSNQAETRSVPSGSNAVESVRVDSVPVTTSSIPTMAPRLRILSSANAEATVIADTLRRRHLYDGVPWSEMAVICRQVGPHLPVLQRALTAAGVPVTTDTADLPLSQQLAADGIITVLEAVTQPASVALMEKLLIGVIGGADPSDIRRLRRGLRRSEIRRGGARNSSELFIAVLSVLAHGEGASAADDDTIPLDQLLEGLTEAERVPLDKVAHVLTVTVQALQQGGSIEEVLWAAWDATGLSQRWQYASLQGGVSGAQADRHLDAMMALFDVASDYVDRVPVGSLTGFIHHVRDQELPALSRIRSGQHRDAVTIVSATSAAGREWDTVAVCGVQENEWPQGHLRGTLMRTQHFLDTLAGHGDAVVSLRGPHLNDERRLFYVAVSRARSTVLVTAVNDNDTAIPSRFLEDVYGAFPSTTEPETSSEPDLSAEETDSSNRILSLPSTVAHLRAVLCASAPWEGYTQEEWEDYQRQARFELARLARAGVPHTTEWWGVDGPSTEEPLWDPEQTHNSPIYLSPSTFEKLCQCPIRWFFDKHGGQGGDPYPRYFGTMMHGLAQASASGVDDVTVDSALTEVWSALELEQTWYSQRELERANTALDNYRHWDEKESARTTLVGVELPLEYTFTKEDLPLFGIDPESVSPEDHFDVPVTVRGRIDRLEKDENGRYVIVDFKTGRNVPTAAEVKDNAQLALYQLVLRGREPHCQISHGTLVYLAPVSGSYRERFQPALTPEELARWRYTVQRMALATRGPVITSGEDHQCGSGFFSDDCPGDMPTIFD